MKTKTLSTRLRAGLLLLMTGSLMLSISSSVPLAPRTAAASASQLAEWTVKVFMDGDNNLESFALDDFQEMARVQNSSQVNVIVQLDRIRNHADEFGDWTHTLRFKMSNGLTPTVGNALPPQVSELPDNTESNMGHPETLISFVEWARRRYPANHYMLVMWDHGDGWRLLHTVSLQKNLPAAREIRMDDARMADAVRGQRAAGESALIDTIPFDRSVDAPHRAISMDDTDRDRLYMREVQTALETSFPAKNLDVLGFDACLMQMVENGFAMRRVAKVMVGSEELEPGDGWQYDQWLKSLVDSPTMDEVALGRTLVRSYKQTYETVDPTTTLSAIDLRQSKMDILAQAISDLAEELTASLPTEVANTRSARESCTPYAPGYGYYGIDLYRFCERLIAQTTKLALRQKAQAVVQLLESSPIVLDSYAGSERQGRFGSHGIAIYFPPTKSAYDSDPFGPAYKDPSVGGGLVDYPVEFVERHRWDNFLHAYFARVP